MSTSLTINVVCAVVVVVSTLCTIRFTFQTHRIVRETREILADIKALRVEPNSTRKAMT